jgi:hypothetical protein
LVILFELILARVNMSAVLKARLSVPHPWGKVDSSC